MQYLLTQEEYTRLTEMSNRPVNRLSDTELQELCSDIADKVPIVKRYNTDKGTLEPWGCILRKPIRNMGYCDKCPVQEICPYDNKRWSQ